MKKTVAVIKRAATSRLQTTMAATCPDCRPPVSPLYLCVSWSVCSDVVQRRIDVVTTAESFEVETFPGLAAGSDVDRSDVIRLESVTLRQLSPLNDGVSGVSDVIRLELELSVKDDDVSEASDDFDIIGLELVVRLEWFAVNDDVRETSGNSDVIRWKVEAAAEDDDDSEAYDDFDVIWLELVTSPETVERDASRTCDDSDVNSLPFAAEVASC